MPPGTLPSQRTHTSESAVFALVLGVAAFLCIGPFAGIPAAILGGIAWSQVRRSHGRLGGGGMAVTGAVLGVAGSVVWVVGLVVLARTGALSPSPTPTATFAPIAVPGPTATAPPPGRSNDEGGQMTTTNEVVETRVGTVTVVDLPPTVRSLRRELDDQQRKARAAHEKLVVLTMTEQCRPCTSIAAVLPDPRMLAALDHVRLVRIDTDDAMDELLEMGAPPVPDSRARRTDTVNVGTWPTFWLLGPDGRMIDAINGGEWGDDTPENAAPVLSAFLRGTLPPAKRKARFTPVAAPPRPAPTVL